MLRGELKHRISLPIHPMPGSSIDNLPPETPVPELDVQLSVNEPLLSDSQLKECNLMNITMESLYSPPDSWLPTGQQYMYTATLPMPLNAERENTVVFAGGTMRPGVDKEVPNKQKKWAMPGNAQGNAVYIHDNVLSTDSIEEEDGDFKGKEDREHRIVAEQDKGRVTWNIDRRCFLDPAATSSFQDKIAKTRYWPIEITRTGVPTGGKGGKGGKVCEDEGLSFHGVCYVNLAPLLYPGVKRIRGAYKVVGFNEQELQEKVFVSLKNIPSLASCGTLADEAIRIANGILSRSSSSPFPKPTGKKDDMKGKEAKKGPTQPKASDSASEADGPVVNVEGQQYVEAQSYILLEICLHRPLVPKRLPEDLAKKVREYIPPRPAFPKRTDGAQRAVNDFHNQVGVVANLILDEYRDLFAEELKEDLSSNDSTEERCFMRKKLIYHLNTSGRYFAFKEQLKHSVVKIVREKYLKTTSFANKDELQAFLSELYVYLVDQMHVGLNNVFSLQDQAPIPAPLTDSAQLKHFAREAEVNENFEMAAKYYQERIARDNSDPDHWFDYGTFCLYINDLTKAEECFRECVSIDQRHLHGLILCGVVCTMQDKNEAAETFFEAATCFEPNSLLAWTMQGLFYDGINNEIGTEMAMMEANKLNQEQATSASIAKREQENLAKERSVLSQPDQDTNINEETTDDLPNMEMTSKANCGVSLNTIACAEGSMAGEQAAVVKTTTPTSAAGSEAGKRSLKDHRNSVAGRTKSGSCEVEPPREPTPVPSQTIFMQIIDFLLEVKAMPFTERALSKHLIDPLGGPSALYHVCLSQLMLQKHLMEDAEVSLKEALQFDHQNPDAWAIMGHVKYLLGDTDSARHCYERTLAFIANASEMHSIYLRLASIYLQLCMFQEAKNTFLMACKRSPSCVSWLGVGIACYRLHELSEAEDALSEANILNNTDPEVWAYLSLVCLRTGRQVEAEQAYKYALKLNLADEDLLKELTDTQEEVGFGNPQL
ncbi:hypothetical protein CAPTEDRAFT_154432 [Capitella teleta]|uniref:Cilia- and flagella-associated protein 70 n=1 Tax=Capitella teleta TaxID=283909 RepID=R7VJ67_CAPTE|nr:hypothetical protein CAPTEDRAFT_154432 [Capitella teleta]|eukprot:ELU15780.1 hypothetical protein CAPTEDRAFT_154432 [Capitella teleta]